MKLEWNHQSYFVTLAFKNLTSFMRATFSPFVWRGGGWYSQISWSPQLCHWFLQLRIKWLYFSAFHLRNSCCDLHYCVWGVGAFMREEWESNLTLQVHHFDAVVQKMPSLWKLFFSFMYLESGYTGIGHLLELYWGLIECRQRHKVCRTHEE